MRCRLQSNKIFPHCADFQSCILQILINDCLLIAQVSYQLEALKKSCDSLNPSKTLARNSLRRERGCGLPVQVGDPDPIQTPLALDPSPLHVLALAPSKKYPWLQEYVALVLTLKGLVVSGE